MVEAWSRLWAFSLGRPRGAIVPFKVLRAPASDHAYLATPVIDRSCVNATLAAMLDALAAASDLPKTVTLCAMSADVAGSRKACSRPATRTSAFSTRRSGRRLRAAPIRKSICRAHCRRRPARSFGNTGAGSASAENWNFTSRKRPPTFARQPSGFCTWKRRAGRAAAAQHCSTVRRMPRLRVACCRVSPNAAMLRSIRSSSTAAP